MSRKQRARIPMAPSPRFQLQPGRVGGIAPECGRASRLAAIMDHSEDEGQGKLEFAFTRPFRPDGSFDEEARDAM